MGWILVIKILSYMQWFIITFYPNLNMLKLICPRSESKELLNANLWTTHAIQDSRIEYDKLEIYTKNAVAVCTCFISLPICQSCMWHLFECWNSSTFQHVLKHLPKMLQKAQARHFSSSLWLDQKLHTSLLVTRYCDGETPLDSNPCGT